MQDVYKVEVHNNAYPPAVIATLSVSNQVGHGFLCDRSTAQNKAFYVMLESPQHSWLSHSLRDSVPVRGFSLQRSAVGAWSVGPRGNKYVAALITAGLISLAEK